MVDDDTNVLVMLNALLGGKFDLSVARNGRDALRLASIERPDLVLLDVEMPGLDGCETCRRFKADPLLANVPIIFLTAHTDEAAEVRALIAGGADFIHKPPRGPAVVARVDNLARMKRLTERMRAEALTDGLTGLSNRHHFDRTLTVEWLCALHMARPLKDALQLPGDLAARCGGEEFVLLLPDTDTQGAIKVAEGVLLALSAAKLPHARSAVADVVTLSLGITAIASRPRRNACLHSVVWTVCRCARSWRRRAGATVHHCITASAPRRRWCWSW